VEDRDKDGTATHSLSISAHSVILFQGKSDRNPSLARGG
jgi:hypothetical protein